MEGAPIAECVRILIIDDEETPIDLLTTYFRQSFSGPTVEVYSARNGDDALSLLKQHHDKIHLVITDDNHPGPRGIEICKVIRERYPLIRTIIMTGYSKAAQEAIAKNISDIVLTKPFSFENLEKAVKKLLPNNQ